MLAVLLAVASPLLIGVSDIASPGIPGPLVVFGKNAEVVVAGKQGKYLEPVIATAEFGKGRVVAFGHGGYFGEGAMAVGQTRQLMINAIRWARKSGGAVGVHRATDTEALLRAEGIASKRLSELDLASLDGLSLLIIDPNNESPKYAASIRKFVEGGGGLMIAGLGWGWLQLNPGTTIREHPCNLIAEPMGIAWADGYLERTAGTGLTASPGPIDTHAGKAFFELIAGKEMPQTGHTLARAVATLDPKESIVTDLDFLLSGIEPTLPSENAPIRTQDVVGRLRLSLDLRRGTSAANPAAKNFPGLPEAGSSPGSRTVEVDLARKRWHSTGLYAIAGKPLRVRSDNLAPGLRLRIGAHSDTLWHLDDWKRAPEVSMSVPITKADMEVTSAFGGLVYVEVPAKAVGKVAVRIDGAVPSPHYVHGKTTVEEWKELRGAPGPWAELESSKIILTVPSQFVRTLDDPKSLMDFWDKVSDACADFAAIPRARSSAERYVGDVQISAGYMHAGYPIMTHLDAAPRMVDLAYLTDKIKGGDWGMFHEIGHNHQESDWTFDGTGEVTNNLFTLYIIETVVGRVPGYRVRFTDDQIIESFRAHRAARAPFDKWKSDPFLALTMYIQLQQAFGWEPFKKVFAEYRKLPQSERPKNDAEKRDQWMVRFSRTVGKDLGPFFVAWGVPVSVQARGSLADLPVWNYPR